MPSMPTDPTPSRTSEQSGMRRTIEGSLHLFSGQLFRLLVNSVYFLLVVRGLGAEDFGRYSAVQALLTALGPFAALGFPVLAIRAIARDPARRPVIWSAGLRVILLFGGGMGLLITFLAPLGLGISFPHLALLLFAVSELILFTLVTLINGVLQGDERLDRMARVLAGLSFARLAMVSVLYFGPGLTLVNFAFSHMVGSLLCVLGALRAYGRGWAWPPVAAGRDAIREGLRDGITISLAASGRGFLMGLGSMLLPAMAGLTAAAQYSAGYRIAAFTLVPLQSFMAALYPRFFRRGATSMASGLALWRRSAPLALAYAVPVATIVYFAAPLLEPVLGEEFAGATPVLQHLIWILIIQSLYAPLGDLLSGADHFTYRSASIIIALLCNLGLNLWLIPDLGWLGAVVAAYGAQVLLLVLYAAKVASLSRGELSAAGGDEGSGE